jgi:hypothetical protein
MDDRVVWTRADTAAEVSPRFLRKLFFKSIL